MVCEHVTFSYLSWCNCSQGSNKSDQDLISSCNDQHTLQKWLCMLEAEVTLKHAFLQERLRN